MCCRSAAHGAALRSALVLSDGRQYRLRAARNRQQLGERGDDGHAPHQLQMQSLRLRLRRRVQRLESHCWMHLKRFITAMATPPSCKIPAGASPRVAALLAAASNRLLRVHSPW